MSYNSATRLTLYAFLYSIETDLRNIIKTHLDHNIELREIFTDEVRNHAVERYQKSEGYVVDPDTINISNLLYYVDFGDLYQALNRCSIHLPQNLASFVKSSTKTFERIIKVRNRIAHSRPIEVDDFSLVYDFSNELAEKFPQEFKELSFTLEKINRNPSYVLGLNIPYIQPDEAKFHNLPIPDFDETGFIGRSDSTNRLMKYLSGPYPVITIVGEGGLGKTALALKVAYDVLDLPSNPFDAIIWSTAKTTQLTTTQIVNIDNAIQTSLGLIENVAETLTGNKSQNSLDEILAYMREFRILLILDNLETVIDNNIRKLMEELPLGSKILITSRIGLGSYECPVKLTPLEENEAISLLRSLAKIRGVPLLVRLPNRKLSNYCDQMHNNPGYIKWFVSAVQTGQRPEDILDNPDLFLEFCMSNVYRYLSVNSKTILKSLQVLPRQLSQAELVFINNVSITDLQTSLQELLSTNMVKMTSSVQGTSFESRYEISELARHYLDSKHPIPSVEHSDLTKKWRQLVAAGEQIANEQQINPFSPYSIRKRSNSDKIVAKYLLDALYLTRQRRYDEADQKVKEARRLAPEYFEVHRVEAWVRTNQMNITAARNSYEAAIELEPKWAPVRLFYANFLLRYFDDLEGALENIEIAEEIDPTAYQIKFEKTRILIYMARFNDAKTILDELSERKDIDFWDSQMIYDLMLSYYQRYAEFCNSRRDNIGCYEALISLRTQFLCIPRRLLDVSIYMKLKKAIPTAHFCQYYISDPKKSEDLIELCDWLEKEVRKNLSNGN